MKIIQYRLSKYLGKHFSDIKGFEFVWASGSGLRRGYLLGSTRINEGRGYFCEFLCGVNTELIQSIYSIRNERLVETRSGYVIIDQLGRISWKEWCETSRKSYKRKAT